ncbi:MAG: tRNA (adenosine(37)-N6)-dimethylallyltransferase MiaA [Rhodospirillales bacterium]
MPRPKALLIAGPTASGKSALALAIAARFDGTIVNVDSMQVYEELSVLTARPTLEEEAQVPHVLYGVRPAKEPGSVAWWRTAALEAMDAARAAGRFPILTGGSGMYFAALAQGLAEIPDPGPEAKTEARALLATLGPEALHAGLTKVDPATAARLKPQDAQRIARAWEVWRGTGIGLAAWQNRRSTPAPWDFAAILLDPPRETLRAAIATRFERMVAQGAIEEVAALLEQDLDPGLPAMRAHGVPEISGYLRKEITLEHAARRTELITGQYTKRQATWFRHHRLADPPLVHTINARFDEKTQLSECLTSEILAFLQIRG